MLVFSPAKINIGLRVLDKRPDGFHHLDSYFYPVPLYDIIEIKTQQADSLVQTGIASTANMEDNLVYKALGLLRESFNIPPLKTHLHKQIPVQAGLGGGSSNASAMLKLLNSSFQLKLSKSELMDLAAKLGSDCPFFIEEKAAHVSGRGESVDVIPFSLKGIYTIIIKPSISINTSHAFQAVKKGSEKLRPIIGMNYEDYTTYLDNDFEKGILIKHPEIKHIKETLTKAGAFYASLSGSGSAVFALFKSKPKINFDSSYFYWQGQLQ